MTVSAPSLPPALDPARLARLEAFAERFRDVFPRADQFRRFVAYLAGGYVAGRMARFSGAKQGFAVWLWAIIAAVVLGVLGAILGAQYDVLSNLDAFPRIPLTADDLTVAGVVTAVVFAAIALVGAILGGLAGMRYHRRVDRVGATTLVE